MVDMMDSPPAKMQQRLEKHFDDLKATRNTSSYPIFALEHGLEQSDVEKVQAMLRLPSAKSLLSSRYWLLWVVYATELGYDYAGDEYWSSFEEKTPEWDYYDRAKIKAWFRKFQNLYGGVLPSGPWADHFNIIGPGTVTGASGRRRAAIRRDGRPAKRDPPGRSAFTEGSACSEE